MIRSPLKRRAPKRRQGHDKAMLMACRGQQCYLQIPGICVGGPETVVAAHSNEQEHGKGMGLKAQDKYTVPACYACHSQLDQGTLFSKEAKFAMWRAAYAALGAGARRQDETGGGCMSYEAVAWALKQPVGHSPAKFILVAIAERAGKENTAWPSVSALVEATCQNRKTVLANMQRLVEMGYLIDTGERAGQTKSVVVYQLNEPASSPKTNTAKQSQNLPPAVPKQEPPSGTDFGTSFDDEAVPKSTRSSPKKSLKQSQNLPPAVPKQEPPSGTDFGTSFDDEAVPKSTRSSPKKSLKQSQKVPEAVPKSSTEPSEPPLGTIKEPPKACVEIPDWMPAEAWAMWDRFRKKKDSKAWTVDAKKLSIRELGKLHNQGQDPASIIEQSVQRGWTGLFPLKTNTSTGASRHGNFAKQDYRAGIGADGSF